MYCYIATCSFQQFSQLEQHLWGPIPNIGSRQTSAVKGQGGQGSGSPQVTTVSSARMAAKAPLLAWSSCTWWKSTRLHPILDFFHGWSSYGIANQCQTWKLVNVFWDYLAYVLLVSYFWISFGEKKSGEKNPCDTWNPQLPFPKRRHDWNRTFTHVVMVWISQLCIYAHVLYHGVSICSCYRSPSSLETSPS